MDSRSFKDGAPIIEQGEVGDGFYIIREGKAQVTRVDPMTNEAQAICTLQNGDFFGEAALLKNQARGATVVADGDLVVHFLNKNKFKNLFLQAATQGKFDKRKGVSAEGVSEDAQRCEGLRPTSAMPTKATRSKGRVLQEAIRKSLAENTLFTGISEKHIVMVIESMWLKKVAKDEIIMKQGELGDNLYVVEAGEFEVWVDDHRLPSKTPYQLMGELALMYGHARPSTVVAAVDSKVWVIDRFSFRSILTNTSQEELLDREATLKTVPVLKSLRAGEHFKLAEALERVQFDNGDIIVRQGDEGDAMYILTHGKVTVKKSILGKDVKVGTLTPTDFFGERALLKNDTRNATIEAKGRVECLRLDRHAFSLLLGSLSDRLTKASDHYDLIDQGIQQELNREAGDQSASVAKKVSALAVPGAEFSVAAAETKKVMAVEPKPKTSKPLEAPEAARGTSLIQRADLDTVGLLGKGSFGTVNLCRHRDDGGPHAGMMLALKSVAKNHVVKTKQDTHIVSERLALATLDHPMVVKLYCTYQDSTYVYFLMEPAMGGELFSLLRTRSMLSNKESAFYAASVLLVFEYMHNVGIVYRDLKPENMLLDKTGYLKLTDFGFAKNIGKDGRTWTLCGTPDYLAPEVITGKGHGVGVDWWCVGILIFEMLTGQAPFYDDSQMKSYSKIKSGYIDYPSHMSRAARDICSKLLQVNHTKRYGVIQGGASLIKEHEWFSVLSFGELFRGEIEPPWKPEIKSDLDLSNFDDYADEPDVAHSIYTGSQHWCRDF
jgi:CRP-like cAMP-binding protein